MPRGLASVPFSLWLILCLWNVGDAPAARDFVGSSFGCLIIRVYLRPFTVPHARMRCPCVSCGMDADLAIQRVP